MLLRRGKPTWKQQFVTVDRKHINFYDSEKEANEHSYTSSHNKSHHKPNNTINIDSLYHVRGITQADMPRSPPQDIPKIFQILYSPPEQSSENAAKMHFLLAKSAQEQAIWVQRLSKKVPRTSKPGGAGGGSQSDNRSTQASQSTATSYSSMNTHNSNNNNNNNSNLLQPTERRTFESTNNIIRSHSPNNPSQVQVQRAASSVSYGNDARQQQSGGVNKVTPLHHSPSTYSAGSRLDYHQSPNRSTSRVSDRAYH